MSKRLLSEDMMEKCRREFSMERLWDDRIINWEVGGVLLLLEDRKIK